MNILFLFAWFLRLKDYFIFAPVHPVLPYTIDVIFTLFIPLQTGNPYPLPPSNVYKWLQVLSFIIGSFGNNNTDFAISCMH